MAAPLKITVLGSGTSVGVPTLGCHCAVCTSTDPRDNRLRPSVLVSYGDRRVLIDTTPDFRAQALRARLERVDAVLYTHAHFDHIMGLDDVRPFNFHQKGRIPIYAAPPTMASIQRIFQYIFDGEKKESNVAQLEPRLIEGGPVDLFGLEVLPVPVQHGSQTIYGFRFGAAAYLTDQRHSRFFLRSAARPGRAVPGCAPLQAASHALDSRAIARDRGAARAAARVLHPYLPCPGA
jgi:phosphoribosyl 1,2-cyclic phosphate phosphodiesterase